MREKVDPVPRLSECKSGRGLEIEIFSRYVGKSRTYFISVLFNKFLIGEWWWIKFFFPFLAFTHNLQLVLI